MERGSCGLVCVVTKLSIYTEKPRGDEHTATHCNTRCNTLQHSATLFVYTGKPRGDEHTATHTATHCNIRVPAEWRVGCVVWFVAVWVCLYSVLEKRRMCRQVRVCVHVLSSSCVCACVLSSSCVCIVIWRRAGCLCAMRHCAYYLDIVRYLCVCVCVLLSLMCYIAAHDICACVRVCCVCVPHRTQTSCVLSSSARYLCVRVCVLLSLMCVFLSIKKRKN